MNPKLNSSVKMDWQTPDSFLALVRQVDPISLDPCTTAENPTGAATWCTGLLMRMTNPQSVIDDGLSIPWGAAGGGGLVYVNPPYGRELPKWVEKCREEAIEGCEIILLVPARTDTKWWQSAYRSADMTLLWRGRIRFKGAESPAPFPSAVFYFGPRAELFRDVFDGKGLFV